MHVVNGSKVLEAKEELESGLFYDHYNIAYVVLKIITTDEYVKKVHPGHSHSLVDFDFQGLIRKLTTYKDIDRAVNLIHHRNKKFNIKNFIIEFPENYYDRPALLFNYTI